MAMTPLSPPKAHRKIALAFLITALATSGYVYYREYIFQEYLHIFHAGSLVTPFDRLAREYMRAHPRVRVICEPYGSRDAVRQITGLHRSGDVVGVSDYTVIVNLMFPQYADWYLLFAGNEMVIAYADHSKYRDEIKPGNWYEILTWSGVKFGRSDPDADPCGYRTLMVWKLAEEYCNNSAIYESLEDKCPLPTRPKESELVALVEARQLDYAFLYLSLAVQHQLEYVKLPEKINLGNPRLASYYAQVSVPLSDGTVKRGEPIMYAVTIPKNAPSVNLAIDFIKLMLSEEGQSVLNECGQPPVFPAVTNNKTALPLALQPYVAEG